MSLMAILGSCQNGNYFANVAKACGVSTGDAGGGVTLAISARAVKPVRRKRSTHTPLLNDIFGQILGNRK